jgi:cytochrome P450 family 89 subfamily A
VELNTTMELTWDEWDVIILAACSFLIPLVFLCNATKRRRRRAPPGPATVPIIGNLAWLTLRDGLGELDILRRLHSRFGPLLSVRLGSSEQVNVADRRLAHALLVERGAAVADRSPLLVSTERFGAFGSFSIHVSSYGPRWSVLRRNFAAEVVSPARFRQMAASRELALADLIRKLKLQEGVVVCRDAFQHAMSSLFIAMCFGKVLDDSSVDSIGVALRDFVLHGGASGMGMALFLFLPALTTRLFRGLLRSKEAKRQKLENVYCLPLIHERRERRKTKQLTQEHPHCYVDTLLDLRLDEEQDGGRLLTDHEIASLCIEILIVGSELPATALEWIMAELVKNPGVQDKLYEEMMVKAKATTDASAGVLPFSEDDLPKIPYLRAVVLEGLRRHPPGHQMPPRRVREDVEVGDYVVPKGSAINFMLYDLGMDDATWDRPAVFMPERFLPGGEAEALDITGTKEMKMIPFGAGRRICPGLRIALLLLEYFVANLVATFHWKEVEEGDVDVTTEDAQLTVLMGKPLRARLLPRLHSSA